jgi:hypothetical protein
MRYVPQGTLTHRLVLIRSSAVALREVIFVRHF